MGFKFVSMSKANDGKHKYEVKLINKETGREKTVKFGASGMKDYTLYQKEGKDVAETRKSAYISRHSKTENWTASGAGTAGFWSRWVLWNKPTVASSLADAKGKLG